MRLSTFQPIWMLLGLLLLGSPFVSWATHHVGGQLSMQAVGDRPGHYRIIVTNYLESGPRADQQGGGRLGIFRKRDNLQMMIFNVQETGQRKPVVYANEFCAEQRNLRFIVVTFEADIQLNPSEYADPQGYYISYQNRNRSGRLMSGSRRMGKNEDICPKRAWKQISSTSSLERALRLPHSIIDDFIRN